ncbi:MAG: MBL fold metallo-hydrolase [Candidatus Micrarchaeia archaeon]
MRKFAISDFKQIIFGNPNFLYLRIDERTCATRYVVLNAGKTLLIDSGDGADALSFTPDICILTHGHYDHARGVRPDWPQVFVLDSEDENLPFVEVPHNAKKMKEGKFKFGSLDFEIINTPGHTRGSMCIFEPKTGILFSGDTKFADGGYGRTDLGGSDEQMSKSLKAIDKLPWKILCPGHGNFEERD